MEELVKKLRYESTWRDDYPEDKDMLLQAADAIEQLQKDLERSKEYEAFWEKEAGEALKKFQVAVASKPRWIPVTEALPKPTFAREWYLVSLESGCVKTLAFEKKRAY